MGGGMRRVLTSLLRIPGEALHRHSRRFTRRVNRVLRRDVSIVSRFLPYRPADRNWVLPLDDPRPDPTPLPAPPPPLWLGYGRSLDAYLETGRRDVDAMRAVLANSGLDIAACSRILDLGCGAGRMLRWLVDFAPEREIWGTDVSAEHILWCQRHLSPPFRFVTTTSCPHLPFEDRYFDLVYAGSVFTHISELADAWLLEIRRVLRPGGAAYLTVHDRRTIELLEQNPQRPLARRLSALPPDLRFWQQDFGMFTIERGFGSLVFYDDRFIRRHWSRFFDVSAIVPEAYDFQTAVLLQKPVASAPTS